MGKLLIGHSPGRWRELIELHARNSRGRFAKLDASFRPIKAKGIERFLVRANKRVWELLRTVAKSGTTDPLKLVTVLLTSMTGLLNLDVNRVFWMLFPALPTAPRYSERERQSNVSGQSCPPKCEGGRNGLA